MARSSCTFGTDAVISGSDSSEGRGDGDDSDRYDTESTLLSLSRSVTGPCFAAQSGTSALLPASGTASLTTIIAGHFWRFRSLAYGEHGPNCCYCS